MGLTSRNGRTEVHACVSLPLRVWLPGPCPEAGRHKRADTQLTPQCRPGNRSELYAKNAKKGKAVAPPKKPGLPLGKWAMGASCNDECSFNRMSTVW